MTKLFYINIDSNIQKRIEFVAEKVFKSLNKEYYLKKISNISDVNESLMERNSIVFTGEDISDELFLSFVDEAMLTNFVTKIIVIYKKEENLHYLLPMRPASYINYNNLEDGLIDNLKKLVKD